MADAPRIILHVDMDAFFASCEELRHPHLRGSPIVVGAAPRRGEGRGVVVAANYAARAFGIRSAMPIRDAWRRNPDAYYLPPDHAHYSSVSRRIFGALRHRYTIEQVSIDEAFLDASGRTDWAGAPDLARALHDDVASASDGLTCSIGAGPNKLLAKVASDFHKPAGTTLVLPAEVQTFLDPLPVRRIPGVGPKTSQRLHGMAIETVRQLRERPEDDLVRAFGRQGAYLHEAAHGRDASRVHAAWEPNKSMSEEHTFARDTRDRRALLAVLRTMVSSLEADLERHGYWYKSVALKLRYSDFETHTKQASLPRHVGETDAARRLVPRLLDAFLEDPRPVRLVGLRFADLAHQLGQTTLRDYPPRVPATPEGHPRDADATASRK